MFIAFRLLSNVIPGSSTSLLSQTISLSNFVHICSFLFPDVKRLHLSVLSFVQLISNQAIASSELCSNVSHRLICQTPNFCIIGGGTENTIKFSLLHEMTYSLTYLTMLASNYLYPFCTWWFFHIFIIYIISTDITLDCSWVVKAISVILVILINPAMVLAIIICNFIR